MCISVVPIPMSTLAFPHSLPNTPHGLIPASTAVNGFNTNMHTAVFKFKGPHTKTLWKQLTVKKLDGYRHLVVSNEAVVKYSFSVL